MAKSFSEAVDAILPLVDNQVDLRFAITHENGGWNVNYFAIDPSETTEQTEARATDFLAFLKDKDPFTESYVGSDFSRGSMPYVYDTILYARLIAEYSAAVDNGLDSAEMSAMAEFIGDHISGLSHNVTDYLTTLDKPLKALMDMTPIPIAPVTEDEKYNERAAKRAVQYIEYAAEGITAGTRADDVAIVAGRPLGASYMRMFDMIVPEARSGGDEPFMIFREDDGSWRFAFTHDKYGRNHGWVDIQPELDKAAFVATGHDFEGMDKDKAYNTVLCRRLSNEYFNMHTDEPNAEHMKLYGMLNMFEANVAEFSRTELAYLTEFDRPLAFLANSCPFSLFHRSEPYNYELASAAINLIGEKIGKILNTPSLLEIDEAELNKRTQRKIDVLIESGELGGKRVIDRHYTETSSVELGGREVFLAVDESEDEPYLVRTLKLGDPNDVTGYVEGKTFTDYLAAMREFVDRVQNILVELETERTAPPTIQPSPTEHEQTENPNPARKPKTNPRADKGKTAKPSALAELDEAKAEAAEYNAALKPATKNERKPEVQEVD